MSKINHSTPRSKSPKKKNPLSAPSPHRLELQIKSLAFGQEEVVKSILEQNRALVEANRAIVEELKINKSIVDQLKVVILSAIVVDVVPRPIHSCVCVAG